MHSVVFLFMGCYDNGHKAHESSKAELALYKTVTFMKPSTNGIALDFHKLHNTGITEFHDYDKNQ